MLVLCSLALLSVVHVDAFIVTVFPEACVSQDGKTCVDDTTTSAGNTMDLKEHCCTRTDGYLGSGATYHDETTCQDLGFHSNKGTMRMGGSTYATIMCDGNVSGFGPKCNGAQIFASCDQQLTMWKHLPKGVAIWRGEDAEEAVAENERAVGDYSASSDQRRASYLSNYYGYRGYGSSERASGLFFSAKESLDVADVVVWLFALVGVVAISSGLYKLFKTQTGDALDVETSF